jgi:hypothetical protein
VQTGVTVKVTLGIMAYQEASAVAITGGAIDSATIGGSTPGAGTFTTGRITTNFSPSADDAAALGTTALGWADLFGATGWTLNIANGNWLATHSSGIMTVTTGDLRVTNNFTNATSVVTVGGAQTLTNKTLTSPTLTTPALGTPASGTLTNCTGLPVAGITSSTSTALGVGSLEVGNASDTTISRSAAGVIAVEGVPLFAGIPQNSQSADYTCVLADAQKHIWHSSADNNPRTFTIPANASVAYPIGTCITFGNAINTVTIAITSDQLVLAGTGSTGSRTLAAAGIATAMKVTSTSWIISGVGLT